MQNALNGQIRELYGRTAWTHKTHEKCADILTRRDSTLKTVQIVFSAVVSGGVLTIIFVDQFWLKILSAIISTLMTFLNTIVRNFNPGSLAQKHSQAAVELWNIRESYLSLLVDLKSDNPDFQKIQKRRDELQTKQFEVFKASPRTFGKAYRIASEALSRKEEMTLSDDEIDRMLPIDLRKNT